MKFRFCGDLDCPDWLLSEIATLSKLTSVRIKVLVNQIIGYCVQGTFNYDKVLKLASDNADGVNDIKGAIAAVHFIIVNASKHFQDEQSLVQEIQQLGLPKENAEALGRQYREHKDMLCAAFAQESYRISKVLSTDWRVDCILASSSSSPISTASTITVNKEAEDKNKVDKPDTGVALHVNIRYDSRPQDGPMETSLTNPKDRIKNATFEISPEKLDLLVHELSTAIKTLDNIEG